MQWVYDSANDASRKLRAATSMTVEAAVIGHSEDTELRTYCLNNSMLGYFPKCNENDLIERYLKVCTEQNFTHMIRVTSDCWQMNSDLICEIAGMICEVDYASNTIFRTFMEGLDLQSVSYPALKWFDQNQKEQREHPFIYFDLNNHNRIEFEKRFKYKELINPQNIATLRTSIDTEDDLKRAREIYEQAKKSGPNVGRKIKERSRAV